MMSLVFDRIGIHTVDLYFMYALKFIWSILVVKVIAKISVDKSINNVTGC